MRGQGLLWLVVLAGWGAGCSAPAEPAAGSGGTAAVVERPAPPAMDYVGSSVCAECHREISEQYAGHPMARASGPLADVPPIERSGDEAAFITSDGRRYSIEHAGGKVFHHEQLPQSGAAPLYDQPVEMELSIGSGRRGRSYGYRRGDRYFMSPIGWYTAKECWDLSPGYVPGRHQRFDRVLTERCLGCHTGRMNPGSAPDAWDLEKPVFEHAIGCERCHGPGASHVEHYRHPATFRGEDRIVNPAGLDAVRRDAVCHQCHFQAGKTIPRYGRRGHDFRPGDRLSDVWVVLKGGIAERQAVTQSEQMLSSTCYRSSGGRLGCVSCHNPHALPEGDPAAAFDQKCAACHADGRSPCTAARSERTGRTCVGCHMPRFDASNVPHTALTDHRILRRHGDGQGGEALAESGPVFDEGEPALPAWEIRRAQALILRTDRKLVRSPLDLERAAATLRGLKERLADDPEVWEMLAWIASRQGKWSDAEAFARRTLELSPERIDARELLLGALVDRAAWPEVERECQRLLQRDPGEAMFHSLLAEAAWRQGELERGMAAAERSLECDPTQVELRQRLAAAYSRLGDAERAQRHRRVLDGWPKDRPQESERRSVGG